MITVRAQSSDPCRQWNVYQLALELYVTIVVIANVLQQRQQAEH
jgi:hypothetical protein